MQISSFNNTYKSNSVEIQKYTGLFRPHILNRWCSKILVVLALKVGSAVGGEACLFVMLAYVHMYMSACFHLIC